VLDTQPDVKFHEKTTTKYRSIITARDINTIEDNESVAIKPSDGQVERRLLLISFTGTVWYTVAIATE